LPVETGRGCTRDALNQNGERPPAPEVLRLFRSQLKSPGMLDAGRRVRERIESEQTFYRPLFQQSKKNSAESHKKPESPELNPQTLSRLPRLSAIFLSGIGVPDQFQAFAKENRNLFAAVSGAYVCFARCGRIHLRAEAPVFN
jgi:hypothetical protein